MSKIGITLGDPAGVGPELIAKISGEFFPHNVYIIYGSVGVLERAFKLTGKRVEFSVVDDASVQEAGVYVIDVNAEDVEFPPEPSVASARTAVSALARCVVDAVSGYVDGILTMPINKYWARKAGFTFDGQTEYIAHVCGVDNYAMVMYSDKLKVALLTTHLPLLEAVMRVKRDALYSKLELILEEFDRLFGKSPRIGVLGLNPHAGEGGEIGNEELSEIFPVIKEFQSEGYEVYGPLSPDSAFLKKKEYDVFLCMYHDQGLIPFKLLAEGRGVNMTMGIPFIRVSPAHGTAYDIAWKNVADPTSSLEALNLLENLVNK